MTVRTEQTGVVSIAVKFVSRTNNDSVGLAYNAISTPITYRYRFTPLRSLHEKTTCQLSTP